MNFLSEEEYFRFLKVFKNVWKEIQSIKIRGEKNMTYLEQTALFLDLLMKHRKYCIDNNLSWNVYPEYFTDNGVYKSTLRLLEESHYIAIHEGLPVWVSWTNPIFPKQTIDNLSMETYSKLRAIQEKENKNE